VQKIKAPFGKWKLLLRKPELINQKNAVGGGVEPPRRS
jgi:hypothetical protein